MQHESELVGNLNWIPIIRKDQKEVETDDVVSKKVKFGPQILVVFKRETIHNIAAQKIIAGNIYI